MPRLLVFAVLLLVACAALAQGPVPLTGPDAQESTALAPQQFHHSDPPDPSLPPAQLEARADELRSQKYYADAIDYYRAALSKEPGRAMLWNKVGIAELQLIRYDDARKDFERALKIDKRFPEAMNNLGVAHYLQSKYPRAIKCYHKALELSPENASFHSNLANAYFARKEFEKATVEYQRAVTLDPDILERQASGGVQAHLGAPQDRARYSYVLAKLYAQTGNLERSLHYLRKAMEEGYPQIDSVYKDQEFATLRKDPRFTDLMTARPQALPQ